MLRYLMLKQAILNRYHFSSLRHLVLTSRNVPPDSGFLLSLLFDVFLPKRRAASELHGVATQKTILLIVTAVRTSNPKLKVVQ
jgi:hypothetical protein